jgi:triacylglycerol lipase
MVHGASGKKNLNMSIHDMSLQEQSLLFAELASLAYSDEKQVKKDAKGFGFTKVKFYDNGGAQAYRFENKNDIVIACRGTQPTEFNDIKADLKALPVMAETISRVHHGFKVEVDELWPFVSANLIDGPKVKQDLWFCGHSLGAAMATIMASRCMYEPELQDPMSLFTYGSPRVGWRKYVKSLGVDHHRFVNNNDIVTRVPMRIMGYIHHGSEHYMDCNGNVLIGYKPWRRFKDRMKGMWMGLRKLSIDNFSDHSMVCYIENIRKWK